MHLIHNSQITPPRFNTDLTYVVRLFLVGIRTIAMIADNLTEAEDIVHKSAR